MLWLVTTSWPVVVAGIFAAVVWSTIHSPKARLSLVAAMLVPALIVDGLWVKSMLGGVFTNPASVESPTESVAKVDFANQVQGAEDIQTPQVRVVQAVSGDVVEVDQNGKSYNIRLIGLDAPDLGASQVNPQCFAQESQQFLNSLLRDRTVSVVTDTKLGEADDEGNLWRYIRMSDGTKVNELMLEAGLAREQSADTYEQKDIFIELAASAKQNNKGLWATCADTGLPKVTPVPSQAPTPTPRTTPIPSTQVAPSGVPVVTPTPISH